MHASPYPTPPPRRELTVPGDTREGACEASLTELLRASGGGDRSAFDRLVPIVYDELRSIAHNRLRAERAGHTLNTTALVHETWLRLAGQERTAWRNRAHFFAIGARAMRRVLVDYARARDAQRRGGSEAHVPLHVVEHEAPELLTAAAATEVLTLNDALDALATFDERGARIVESRFFGGLTHAEIAEALELSEVTVRRSWTSARAWLRRELAADTAFERSGVDLGADGGTGAC